MELRQLIYFRTVAQMQHVTRASEHLMVAQSAISRQIQLLEQELGAPLFFREGKRIRLSPLGTRFLPHAERILRNIEQAKAETQSFRNPHAGTIHLGFPHSVGVYYVPRLIAAFQQEFPEVSFDLVQARVSALLSQLRDGDLELAIVTPWDTSVLAERYPGRFLTEEPLFIVLPEQHPLCQRKEIHLSELRDEPFVVFKEGYTLRKMVWDACIEAGFVPRIAFEAEETDTIRAFVQAGLGISVLPPSETAGALGIREVAISNPPLQRAIGMAWWQDSALSAAAKEFVSFASKSVPVFNKRVE
ncbi:LysR family transcriptional regulator [Alicyclobacillus sp. SO9]|uniref:LysR family transcriptional regulator n=1 Tax=Alicyclobacillus sp. SO9 TaxID=2665646 RepID=UPI0018E72232|nr:LysR family transcriptional regulator [Alicyclobacillus sp. SO9]QQE79368.1 LysR family transcriptional regulator [Alicyclobacillus sp. SO9]